MIYAINRVTKEHRVYHHPMEVDFWAECELVQADDDGWIPHDGRECPLPDGSVIDIRYRYPEGKELHRVWPAEDNNWLEVVAYRPILDAKPEAPEWDGECLPPVGWCGEYRPYWHACEVIAYHKGFAVVWDAHDLEYFRTKNASIFRPIRTAEDKAVEEMQEHVGGHVKRDSILRALYRAGFRQQAEEATDAN